jgi:hypothetical protein
MLIATNDIHISFLVSYNIQYSLLLYINDHIFTLEKKISDKHKVILEEL